MRPFVTRRGGLQEGEAGETCEPSGSEGCASSLACKRGLKAEQAARYTEAIRQYSEAAALKPDDPRYRIALSSALIKSGEAHIARGEALEKGGELELAYREYNDAYLENPLNDLALLKRDKVRQRILVATAPAPGPKEPPIPSPLEALEGRRPVTLRMADAELTEVFTSIERLSGVVFIYDETYKLDGAGS